MTTHKTNTIITIDLKEYARLQEIEKAAWGVIKARTQADRNKALDMLSALLDGAE